MLRNEFDVEAWGDEIVSGDTIRLDELLAEDIASIKAKLLAHGFESATLGFARLGGE